MLRGMNRRQIGWGRGVQSLLSYFKRFRDRLTLPLAGGAGEVKAAEADATTPRAAIDYMVQLPCEPKRRFGLEGLLKRLRLLDSLGTRLLLQKEDEIAAREALFELRPVAYHCSRCPANHRNREFGCFGSVRLPLSAEAEVWLLDLLPDTLNPKDSDPEQIRHVEAAAAMVARLRELGVDGAPVDDFRGDGFLLARPKPAVRSYGWFVRRVEVKSSALLQPLLFAGGVEPATAELLCRGLGVWQDGTRDYDGIQEAVFTQPDEEGEDTSVAELKHFFLALMVACSMDLPVQTWVHDAAGEEAAGLPEPKA